MILIGYSGHSYVVCGIFNALGRPVTGYCDIDEKNYNPFNLIYLGKDDSDFAKGKLKEQGFFISIGDNQIRQKIFNTHSSDGLLSLNAIHPSAVIDHSVKIDPNGVMIAAGVCINPLAEIGIGSICNTGSVIEHECKVGMFAHIGPGAVLCGNVSVGNNSFVGAGSVIKQGIKIGNNVTIGAGAVVIRNISDNEIVAGNPSRTLIKL